MHDDRAVVERRIERELTQRVAPHLHPRWVPMAITAWEAPGEPVTREEALAQRYEPFAVGTPWGRPWGTTWFRLRGEVPAEWAGRRVEAIIDLGFSPGGIGFQAEGLVWDDDGPLQGVHPRRTAVVLPGATGTVRLDVEAASNATVSSRQYLPSRLGSLATAGTDPLYRFARADLAVRDDEVHALLLDADVLRELMLALPLTDPRRARLLRTLARALDAIDVDDVSGTAAAARAILRPALALPARASSMRVVGVGHAHIDSAWHWPARETVRKCARTFASAVRVMEEHPEYRFVCSQAVHYAWMEERHPALFERIRTQVAAGRFVPVGGMWVESDMNLPSGESIVRQFVHGQRFFESRFGSRCREVWIPDVFGYPATLPQIFVAAGCTRFVTQKLSWNKQNRFPHHTFWWEGLDGTRVLSHFPPVDNYNAEVTAGEMAYSEANFREHGWSDWALMPYGYGNGGGGPTLEMVERAQRMADLDGLPRLELGTVDEFFTHIEREVADGAPVPVWQGELYFEMHRGTLTSQIETKVGNRRCERLLREAELWWAAGGAVPAEVTAELDRAWKDVLFQQFHDVLPGSSIRWVHEEAEAEHARVGALLERSIERALSRLALDGPTVANAATHARTEVVEASLRPVGAGPVQELSDGRVAFAVTVPGSGLAALVADDVAVEHRVVVGERSMANGLLEVTWDGDGTICSIVDVRRGRELLCAQRTVHLELAPDHPVQFDAWDVEEWTPGLGQPLGGEPSVRVIERGPLVASIEVSRRFGRVGASSVTTVISMRAGSPRLDLTFDIDWHEDEQLLSLVLPLDVRAPDAVCDIQFGHVRRPTHPSNPWDAAKFEVCAHRFVDLAEADFGVAVLNDGRFGHGLFGGGVRVSMLRAAKYPDPEADHGRHRCTISVLPHGPGLHEVLAQAEALNVPLRIVDAPGTSSAPAARWPEPVLHVAHAGVQVSAVKRADDGSGDLIVRLHEACGARTKMTVTAAGDLDAAARADLFESPTAPLAVSGRSVDVPLRPFELVTLRLTQR